MNAFPADAFSFSEADRRFMTQALRLAARAAGHTAPNPVVGAVIVRDGQVIGRGYHRRAGTDHAEVAALKDAAGSVRGADMYVTLEPCSHFGRTPPCADALVAAGLRRVIVAVGDPNPKVRGQGVAQVQAAGIDVAVGLMRDEAIALNEGFMHFHLTGRPLVTCKWAMTLDGQTATATGDSRWITNARSRRFVHRLRSLSDAVLAGSGTVAADDPLLNVRLPRCARPQPLRVIADSALSIGLEARILQDRTGGPVWLLTTDRAPAEKVARLEAAKCRVVALGQRPDGRVDLSDAIRFLAAQNVQSLFVEGGPHIHGSLMEAGLCDRVVAFVAPRIVGAQAQTARPPLSGWGVAQMREALILCQVQTRRFGDDVCIWGARRPWAERFAALGE